jgi:hypothetical protein
MIAQHPAAVGDSATQTLIEKQIFNQQAGIIAG